MNVWQKFRGSGVLYSQLVLQLVLFVASWFAFYTDDTFFNTFQGSLSYTQIQRLIDLNNAWLPLSCILVLLAIIVRMTCTAVCLYIGLFFANQDVAFRRLWQVCVRADVAFLIGSVVTFTWHYFFFDEQRITDLQIPALSVASMLYAGELSPLHLFLLSMLNAFEILYWIFLAMLLKEVIDSGFIRALGLVATSYGVGLFFYLLIVSFLMTTLDR